MSYVKTQWVNNTTPINDTNLNKIEQGIYDNSLVVDAITNTLNPTDTETYKTAELTEGQITDVIGVNDIVIKGQTSQNGEPTPSSPVDVNVVSGSNVVNTSNKNLLNINNAIAFKACTIQLQNNSIKIVTDGSNNAIVKIPCVLTAGNYYLHFEGNANIVNVAFYNSNQEKIIANNPSSSKAITLSDNLAYININLSNVAGTYTLAFNKLYINLGSTDLSYEPHQGKNLALDLPVENLFDEVWEQGTISNTTGENSSGSNIRRSVNYIPVLPETTYVFNRTIAGNTMPIREYGANKQFIGNKNPFDGYTMLLNKTFTTSSNVYFIRLVDFVNNSNNKVMIEQGSKANAYTPYGTDPIQLCKIGNYQDYLYKSGSKWYLHKEVEKRVVDGSNDETWTIQNSKYFICSRINNQVIHANWVKDVPDVTNIKSTIGVVTYTVLDNQTGYGLALAYGIRINLENINASSGGTVEQLRAYLAENPVTVYVAIKATDTEITDTTLISQLEAIYNAPLYEQTNITQTNNDLPMVLDITACKDNINGIKAFIRK